MLRFLFAAFIFPSFAVSQNLPAYRWIHEVDNSGADSFAGLAVDLQGNTYIAGNTLSATFPVKGAAQNHLASSGLYRIDGPGQAYAGLGLTSAQSVTADPQVPNMLYAVSTGRLMRSTDGGATFSVLTLSSTQVEILAINPANNHILYAGTFDQGMLKSTDGGATWSPSNGSLTGSRGQFSTQGIWIDPSAPDTLYANTAGNFVRSTDGGASWQTILILVNVVNVTFDPLAPGVIYAAAYGNDIVYRSADHGQSFTNIATPAPFQSILADPNHPGRLLASTMGAIYESDDAGSTWTAKVNLGLVNPTSLTADWASGFLYIALSSSSIVRITTDLQTTTPVGPPAVGYIQGIAAANGHAYIAVSGTHDVFVTKLDPSGNVVYSTYFGGSAEDTASAMTVDSSGYVYVTGNTGSLDFPVTKGAYASKGNSFVFRLTPDGALDYSTYFATSATPAAIAVDGTRAAYIAGTTGGNLPVTPGAYQSTCNCAPISTGFLTIFVVSGFAAKFNADGSNLLYSTYIGGTNDFGTVINALAVGGDATAYVASQNGIYRLNRNGTALVASSSPPILNAQAMAVTPDGSLYLAGTLGNTKTPFQTTPGAFQPASAFPPALPGQVGLSPGAAIAKLDPQLANVQAATYFGSAYDQIKAITLDQEGNVYVGGATGPQGLPTRTPLQGGFASNTGFLSELTGDLSTLLFSSYVGDNEYFGVQGVAASPNGSVMIGGTTGQVSAPGLGPMNIYVNNLTLTPPPALRIDSVVNAASLLDAPLSPGETFVVRGAGFGSDAQLTIGADTVPPISITPTTITAVVPQTVPASAAQVQVRSGGIDSNPVLVPAATAAPGVFSQNGSGYGQGYILNKDGTLNTPSNPAAPGDRITIFATGVGPLTFTGGYAVTQAPVNIYVGGFYASGVSAVMTPVDGLPGSVYQITVMVPKPSDLAANNPDLKNFSFPPLVGLIMRINNVNSQNGIAISISQ